MTLVDNPRAVIGDNRAQSAADNVKSYLERDYKQLTDEIDLLLAEARQAPRQADSDEEATTIGSLVKKLRELDKRIEAVRETEKAPHRLAAEAVDAFFFPLREKLGRRNPRDHKQKPGVADILQSRLDDFLERRRLEEETKRRAEADKLRREAEERERIAREEARKAEEARLAAERARNATRIAEKQAVAQIAEQQARQAEIDAQMAAAQAQEAHIATLAKPADMSRTRGDGVLLTQAREAYVIVVDRSLLDKDALWSFFTDAEIEKALRGWAKTTNHNKPMTGAEIGYRRKGVTR